MNQYYPKPFNDVKDDKKAHIYSIRCTLDKGIFTVFVYDQMTQNEFQQKFTQDNFPKHKLYDVAKIVTDAIQSSMAGGSPSITCKEWNGMVFVTVSGHQIPTLAIPPNEIDEMAQIQLQQHLQAQNAFGGHSDMASDPKRKMKLKPLKWTKPLKKGKTKTQIFIWGKARPPNMFPASSDQATPYHVDNLSKKKIWSVSAAREGYHCYGIGQNDWCFVWGETKQIGALGLGTNARVTTPFLIRALRKQRVKQACCSAIHSLCITDQLVIYGWGSKELTLLDYDKKEPVPIDFLNGKGLKKLAAANTHSLAWNPNSIEVYSFGKNGPWLGYDDDHDGNKRFGIIKFDTSISHNDGFSVTFADCSSQYTLLILNTGYVGACGINEHGRMGVGIKIQSTSKVLWMTNMQNIVLCSAGSFHAGFVDTEGIVYTCGVGEDYRLGHGDQETVWEPKKVEVCRNIKVCQIEAVDSRTFVITTEGNLIMWGKEAVTARTHATPYMYEYLNAYRIYDICCAQDFQVAIGVRAKEPIPKPNINESQTENDSDNNMNKLIGDVIGGNEQKFDVDSVYSTFIKSKKTIPDNSQQPLIPPPPLNMMGGFVPNPKYRQGHEYNENVVNQLINLNIGTFDECIAASKMVMDFNDINQVADKITQIKSNNNRNAGYPMLPQNYQQPQNPMYNVNNRGYGDNGKDITTENIQKDLSETRAANLRQQETIKKLTEKLKEEKEMDIKQHTLSLTSKINEYGNIYNKNTLNNLYQESPNSLISIEQDIEKLKLSANVLIKKASDIQSYIESLNKPNPSGYNVWDLNMLMKWIESLENGRFVKYSVRLRKGFETDAILSGSLLPMITKNDLRNDPFKITSFEDRTSLYNHFQSLKSQNLNNNNNNHDEKQQSDVIMENEGIETAYIPH